MYHTIHTPLVSENQQLQQQVTSLEEEVHSAKGNYSQFLCYKYEADNVNIRIVRTLFGSIMIPFSTLTLKAQSKLQLAKCDVISINSTHD